MKLKLNDFSEVSQHWLYNFADVHYPSTSIVEENGDIFLDIEEVVYDYILSMNDKEIEEYLNY